MRFLSLYLATLCPGGGAEWFGGDGSTGGHPCLPAEPSGGLWGGASNPHQRRGRQAVKQVCCLKCQTCLTSTEFSPLTLPLLSLLAPSPLLSLLATSLPSPLPPCPLPPCSPPLSLLAPLPPLSSPSLPPPSPLLFNDTLLDSIFEMTISFFQISSFATTKLKLCHANIYAHTQCHIILFNNVCRCHYFWSLFSCIIM